MVPFAHMTKRTCRTFKTIAGAKRARVDLFDKLPSELHNDVRVFIALYEGSDYHDEVLYYILVQLNHKSMYLASHLSDARYCVIA